MNSKSTIRIHENGKVTRTVQRVMHLHTANYDWYITLDGEKYFVHPECDNSGDCYMTPFDTRYTHIEEATVIINGQETKQAVRWLKGDTSLITTLDGTQVVWSNELHVYVPVASPAPTSEEEQGKPANEYQERLAREQAEERANQEQKPVYVIMTRTGLHVRTVEEIYKYHLTESLYTVYTANPAPSNEGEPASQEPQAEEEQEQGQEQLDTTGMECIGKQYIMVEEEVYTAGTVYTPDYATGIAKIGDIVKPVKFYKNAEGVNFPLLPGDSIEFKSVWVPASQVPQFPVQQQGEGLLARIKRLVNYEDQIMQACTLPLTDFTGITEFGDYVSKAMEALQIADYDQEHISISAIQIYLRRHHLYTTFDAVYNYLEKKQDRASQGNTETILYANGPIQRVVRSKRFFKGKGVELGAIKDQGWLVLVRRIPGNMWEPIRAIRKLK